MATLGGALALNARRHPDKTALIFGESTYSYEQLAARINQYAHALASLGVGKGDRVALLSPNSDAYILGLYGAFRLGAIAVPLNPRVPARELRYLLEDSGATVLLYSEGLAVVVAGLDELDPLPSAPQSLVLDEPAAQGIARLADTMPTTAPEVEVIEDDDCIILYTSGTTGRPKGALFDHHRMLWVGNSVSALGMNIFDRNLHVAPMYHCAELSSFSKRRHPIQFPKPSPATPGAHAAIIDSCAQAATLGFAVTGVLTLIDGIVTVTLTVSATRRNAAAPIIPPTTDSASQPRIELPS